MARPRVGKFKRKPPPKGQRASAPVVDTTTPDPLRPDLDPYWAWVRPALERILAPTGNPVPDSLVQWIMQQSVASGDADALQAAMATFPDIDSLFPGYTASVNSGNVAQGDFAGFNAYKRGINEAFLRHEGRDMTDEEWRIIATEGHSAGFIEEFVVFRGGFREMYERRFGRAPTDQEIGDAFKTGKTLGRFQQEFDAGSYLEANRGDIQGVAGSFNFGPGGGAFSEEQLQAFALQREGVTSPLGADVLRRVQQAQQRFQRIFAGQVAQGQVALPSASQRGRPGSRVDVGA